MINRHRLKWTILLALLPFFAVPAAANPTDQADSSKSQVQLGIAYLWPIDADRDISTINLNAWYPIKEFDPINLSVYAGLSGTYARGEITQLEGQLSEGTLRKVEYDTKAIGLGPVIRADLCAWRWKKFSFHFDASGGLIFYNQDFPAGGDRYNFMWRAGPVVRYGVTNNMQMGLGWRWMHVSNGQGSGPDNPSYDAQGLNLQFLFPF